MNQGGAFNDIDLDAVGLEALFSQDGEQKHSDAVVADLNALVPLGWWGYRCLEQSKEHLPIRSSTMTSIEIETSR